MKSIHTRRAAGESGFTLIELMIVVVVVSILATIAISSYTNQVRKSRRTDARTALLDFASREERYMSTNSSYTDVPANLGYTGAFPITIGGGYYQINRPTVTPAAAGPPMTTAAFSIVAQPVPGKGQDKDAPCQTFTVDNTGKQSATAQGGGDATSTCWN